MMNLFRNLIPLFWKPFLGIAVLMMLYSFGYVGGQNGLKFKQLYAQNIHLKKHALATQKVYQASQSRAKIRDANLQQQQDWIKNYEKVLLDRADQCLLNDDIDFLHKF